MKFDLKHELKNRVSEVELPEGHQARFAKKLDTSLHLENNLWKLQRYAIAASLIAFLGIALVVYASIGHFNGSDMLLSGFSTELYETETYLRNQIDTKLDYITSVSTIDQQVLVDINELDTSFQQVQDDLRRNPGDERLISAVLETYQIKIELLDEIISKVQ